MKMLKVLFAAAMAIGAAAPALAQDQATATGFANIIVPVEITTVTNLSFGTVTRGAGTVTVDNTDGTRDTTGDVTLVDAEGGTAASFDVTGDPSRAFSTTIGTLSLVNGANPALPVTLNSTVPTALDSSGEATITVGGTITLTASTPTGNYTGNFTVDVSYN